MFFELIQKILIRYLGYGIELTQKTSRSKDIQDKSKVYEFIKNKFEEKAKIAEEKLDREIYEKISKEFYGALEVAQRE